MRTTREKKTTRDESRLQNPCGQNRTGNENAIRGEKRTQVQVRWFKSSKQSDQTSNGSKNRDILSSQGKMHN